MYVTLPVCTSDRFPDCWISQASNVANCHMEVINWVTWEKICSRSCRVFLYSCEGLSYWSLRNIHQCNWCTGTDGTKVSQSYGHYCTWFSITSVQISAFYLSHRSSQGELQDFTVMKIYKILHFCSHF